MRRADARLFFAGLAFLSLSLFAHCLAAAVASTTAPTTRAASVAPAATTLPVSAAAASAAHHLFAQGSDDFFWVAEVIPATGKTPEMTRIYFRQAGSEAWQHVSDLPARATSVACSALQLAVLLDSGNWILVSEDGTGSTGQALPGGAQCWRLPTTGMNFGRSARSAP